MKTTGKKVPVLAVLCALLIAAVFATAAAAAKDPFIGVWYSIDTDGSSQTLNVGGGPGASYRVRYYDDGATVCGLDPDTGEFLYAAWAMGWLTKAGDSLAGTLPVYCQAAPPYKYNDSLFTFTYDSATDTLTDSHGVIWSR